MRISTVAYNSYFCICFEREIVVQRSAEKIQHYSIFFFQTRIKIWIEHLKQYISFKYELLMLILRSAYFILFIFPLNNTLKKRIFFAFSF